jgi:hypothetical protein
MASPFRRWWNVSANEREPPFDPVAIMIDPGVPEGPRQSLAHVAERASAAAWKYQGLAMGYGTRGYATIQPKPALIRFRDPVKEPPRRPRPPTPPPAPRELSRYDLDKGTAIAWGWGISTLAGAVGALITSLVGTILLTVLLSIFAASAFLAWIWSLGWEPPDIKVARRQQSQYQVLEQGYQVSLDQWQRQHAAVIYHRRYVTPATDLEPEGMQVWARAVKAANSVYACEVADQALIDLAQVKAIMPYRLWEIAERLARIAMLRDQQGAILGEISPDHPDVARIVSRQRRALGLAAEDVDRRVHKLEVLADRLEQADAAKRHEGIVLRLANLNDPLREIVADRDVSIGQPEIDERAGDDIETVIEQSRQAIQEANEAALSLVLPDNGEDDSTGASAGEPSTR